MELKGVYLEGEKEIIDSLIDKMKFIESLIEESMKDQQILAEQQKEKVLSNATNNNKLNSSDLIKLNEKIKSFDNMIGSLGGAFDSISDERIPAETTSELAVLGVCLGSKASKDIEDKLNKTILNCKDNRKRQLSSAVGEIQKALSTTGMKNLRFSNDGTVSDRYGFTELNNYRGTKDIPATIKDLDKAVSVYEDYLSHYSKMLTARPLTLANQEQEYAPSPKIIDDIVLIHQIKRNTSDRKTLHEIDKIEESLMSEDRYQQAQTLALSLTTQGKGLTAVGSLDFSKAIDKIEKEVDRLKKEASKSSQYLTSFDYKNRLKEINAIQQREKEEQDKILPPNIAGPIFNLFMKEFREKAKSNPDDLALYNIDLSLLKIMDENNVTFAQYRKIREDAENAYAKEVAEKNAKEAQEGFKEAQENRQQEIAQEKVEAEIKKEQAKETVANVGAMAQEKVANQPTETQVHADNFRINEITKILTSTSPEASSLYIQDMAETIAGYDKYSKTGILFAVYYAKTHNGKFMDETTEKLYDNYLKVLQNMQAGNTTPNNDLDDDMEM